MLTSRGSLRREISAVMLCAGLLGVAAPVGAEDAADPHAATDRYRGRSVKEVLDALQAQGLAIVFTSELVPPGLRVLAEPSAREPRELLDELLAQHGLEAREGPGGVLVVVASKALASIEGTVQPLGGSGGLAGAVVRVAELGLEALVGEDGHFRFALAPGAYTLEARAAGYLEQRVDGVAVRPGGSRLVELRLHPQPFFADEIVVRSSRLTLLDERPDSSFSLGRQEIESLPHLGDDAFRATSLLPGTAANDVTAQLSVHGGRRDEVGVFLDGQELYEAYHLKDYDSALSIVPARTLSSVSLTTGAYPASQGDRMSGVLDLRTIDPDRKRRTLVGVSVVDAQLSRSGTFAGERGGWLLTGRRGSIDLAAKAVGAEHPSFWDLLGKVELDAPRGSLSARLLTTGDDLEVDRADEDGFEVLENDYRNTYGWLTQRATLGERLLVETGGSWSRVQRRRGGSGNEEEGGHLLFDRRDLRVLAFNQTWDLQIGPRHVQRWGWEARRYDATLDYAKDLALDVVVIAPFSPPRATIHRFDDTVRGDHLGAWASDRFSVGPWTAELGARWDRHTATDDTLWSPRLNLAWRLGEKSVVRAAWGRFYQSQRPYELQVEDGESALFEAERSHHAVLGFETLLAANAFGLEALRLELFHREIGDPRPRYENLLEPLNFFPEIEPDRVRITPERSTAKGVELVLRGRRGARFDWWLAYSYARAEDRIAGIGGVTEDTVPRGLDQPHTLAVDLSYRFPRNWSLNLAWRYRSGWPTTPVAAAFVVDPEDPEAEEELVAVFGRLYSERLPAYHRLDLRASRRWELREGRRGQLTFFVDVQNLYNRRNPAGFDLKLDDEAGTVELDAEHWPGIFPSLGIAWEL